MTAQAAGTPLDWLQANQACLVMEFARLRERFDAAGSAPAPDDEAGGGLRRLRETLEPAPAIDQLAASFGLSDFERQVVLLCAGVEMDSMLAARCREALGRDHRGAVTFSLALSMLDAPHWSALAPSAPLRRAHLVAIEPARGLTEAALRIDERILHYLAGLNRLDARLEALLRPHPFPEWIAPEHAALADEVLATFDPAAPGAPVVQLCGDDPHGQEDVAAAIGRRIGCELHVLPVERLHAAGDPAGGGGAADAMELVALWAREARLMPVALLVQCGSTLPGTAALQAIEQLSAPLMIASREALSLDRSAVRHAVDKPMPASQKALWLDTLAAAGAHADAPEVVALVDDLSEQFRLSARTISSLGGAPGAVDVGTGEGGGSGRLWAACRSIARPRLEGLADRIVPAADWSELILPDAQQCTLREIAAQARRRMTVYESWGFAARGRRGLGMSALFAGASGTGKTLAAEVLAKALRLDLFRVDLSAVVSKYIGESEKNLKRVFDAAEDGGVLLLFDEADALFGKRAEVKDSHDRFANIEVSYLLQRMESFQGLAVLTTNLKSSIDKAFQRRLRFVVDFPFPGADERESIWRRAIPAGAPTRALDLKRLAQVNMTGGSIRNITLNAAFLAAEAGTPIGMTHMLHATRQEAMKAERPLAESEIRGWA